MRKRAVGVIVDKLVVKTAVKTVLIIVGILVILFAVVNFGFPQHMATATESIGNYALAVKYADLRYKYTKKVEDLARCFDDSVLLGDDKIIIEYGEKLISHEGYEALCDEKNEEFSYVSTYDYDIWVKAKICVSVYNTGERGAAILRAQEYNGKTSFPYGNPLMSLAMQIFKKKDAESAKAVLDVLQDLQKDLERVTEADEDDKVCLQQIIEMMTALAGK